ncbi:MAG TPA: alpha/beta hydrolase [Lacunisphaera sp.]|nr:alpha/beta hydrolase [Lacunisphaera sp.]
MPKYWMITNRNADADGLGNHRTEQLSFYTADGGSVDKFTTWTARTEKQFRVELAAQADKFPLIPEHEHERQKHVTLFVHGYNNDWRDAALRYQQISDDMYLGAGGLGICILFTWPSNGQTAHYLADRDDARASGPALSRVFNLLYDQASLMEAKAADGTGVCKAKVSVIAHSMGNWVLQNALKYTWERYNKPLLVSLINQCLMVAADVDNDLFAGGDAVGDGPAEGMANLCYRITAFYTGRDSVLGVSAGLKHFGKRRLGRSGLDREVRQPDNVWDVDCSGLFKAGERNYHSAYFWTPKIQAVLKTVLQGYDRGIVEAKHT